MKKTLQNNIGNIFSHREQIFYILVAAIFLVSMSYAVLVHATVENIISHESLLKQNRNKTASIGMLEAQYFILKNSVTLSMAQAKGFSEPIAPTYISKKAQGVARTTSNEI